MLTQQQIGVIGMRAQYGMKCRSDSSLETVLTALQPTLATEKFNRDVQSSCIAFTFGGNRGKTRFFLNPDNSGCVLIMMSSQSKRTMQQKWGTIVDSLSLVEHNYAVSSPAAEGGTPCTQAARALAHMAGTTVASNTRSHLSLTSNTISSTK
jgi:hypothetical protein